MRQILTKAGQVTPQMRVGSGVQAGGQPQPIKSIPIRIRSGLRAGGAGGPCDVAYWRSELNYWRKLAEQMGCA